MAHRTVKPHGLFLLHSIGNNGSVTTGDPWFDKYIFPGGMLPSVAQLSTAMEGLFVMEDWHNFGPDYDTTLLAWQENVDKHRGQLAATFDERFSVCGATIFLSRGLPRPHHPPLADRLSKGGLRADMNQYGNAHDLA